MKRSPRSRLLAGAVAAIAVTTFVAACSDDDDAATTSVATTTGRPSATTETSTSGDDTASDETVDTTDGSDASTGGGSASGDEAEYVAALRANINLEDEEMATCLAQAVVDQVGFDRIQDSGMSPDEFANSGGRLGDEEAALAPEQADELALAFEDCGDLADAFITAESVPEEQKECERGALTNEIAAALLANQLTNAEDSEEVAAASEQASKCAESTSATTTTG
jgi:hypothetical protein